MPATAFLTKKEGRQELQRHSSFGGKFVLFSLSHKGNKTTSVAAEVEEEMGTTRLMVLGLVSLSLSPLPLSSSPSLSPCDREMKEEEREGEGKGRKKVKEPRQLRTEQPNRYAGRKKKEDPPPPTHPSLGNLLAFLFRGGRGSRGFPTSLLVALTLWQEFILFGWSPLSFLLSA